MRKRSYRSPTSLSRGLRGDYGNRRGSQNLPAIMTDEAEMAANRREHQPSRCWLCQRIAAGARVIAEEIDLGSAASVRDVSLFTEH